MTFDFSKWVQQRYPGPEMLGKPPKTTAEKVQDIVKHRRKYPLLRKPTAPDTDPTPPAA